MIGFTIIGGYLGAGKTTLLNQLLAHCGDRRLGVIVNDFGAINIDAALVSSRTATRINLNNGCVCCTMVDGFNEALDTLLESDPSPAHIVVEASGVADVHQLAQYGHVPGLLLEGVIVVADAETLPEKLVDRYVGRTIRRQLASADLIVLNKVDLLPAELIGQRLQWLAAEFPQVRVLPCERGDLPAEVLLGIPSRDRLIPLDRAGHEHYASWHLQLEKVVESPALERFASGLDPQVLRAKGFVVRADGSGWVLQVVGRRSEVTAFEPGSDASANPSARTHLDSPAGTYLVAIGLAGQLDHAALDRLAASCFG